MGDGVLGKRLVFSLAAAVLVFAAGRQWAPGLFPFYLSAASTQEVSRSLPEFTSADPDRWLNSPPLKVADMEGQVVFLDVWTFG